MQIDLVLLADLSEEDLKRKLQTYLEEWIGGKGILRVNCRENESHAECGRWSPESNSDSRKYPCGVCGKGCLMPTL